MKKRNLPAWRWGLVAAAVAVAVVPLPPAFIDRWYSGRIYAVLQPALTSVSNRVPFALMDIALAAVVGAFVLLFVRDFRAAGWMRTAVRLAERAAIWGACMYLAFAAVWGFNYRRSGLDDRLPYDQAAVTAEAVARLATIAVERLNALHDDAHARGWPEVSTVDPDLAAAFARAMQELGAAHATVVGRPKRTMLDWYFQRAGVSGMVDPLFLEILVAGDLLPFERPFVVAHEWSHLAGLADEGEANLAGWLTCLRGTVTARYSGWLFMYGEAVRAVQPNGAAIAAKLAEGPRADLRAIRDRYLRHVNPQMSAAGWRVYDSYLKANRVEAGAASYEQVVRLALGLRAARIEE